MSHLKLHKFDDRAIALPIVPCTITQNRKRGRSANPQQNEMQKEALFLLISLSRFYYYVSLNILYSNKSIQHNVLINILSLLTESTWKLSFSPNKNS
jgi:hypothetical protein